MEIKKRNTIIGAISIIIGVILIIWFLPWFTSPYGAFSIVHFFISPYGASSTNALLNSSTYIYLDFFVLAITMFIYAYFLIKPTRTLKGKQNIAISAMVFGLVLVILPMIGIGLEIYSYSTSSSYIYYYSYIFLILMNRMPLFLMLIPGVALLLHGWFLRKKLRTEEAKDVGPEELVVLSSPEEMISKRELKKMDTSKFGIGSLVVGSLGVVILLLSITYTLWGYYLSLYLNPISPILCIVAVILGKNGIRKDASKDFASGGLAIGIIGVIIWGIRIGYVIYEIIFYLLYH